MTQPDPDDVVDKKLPAPSFAKKRLGQNFLINARMIDQMMNMCAFTKEDVVLEIGPGKGAITRSLSQLVKQVIAVEADKKLAEALSVEFSGSNVTVHQGDILDLDLASLPARVKLFGNIPYNISTPILAWMLKNRTRFSSCFLTVQLEFAERMLSCIKTKDRCPLSCFIEAFTDTKILLKVHPRSFQPMPKVMSCFMRSDIKDKPSVDIKDEVYFEKIIREAFLLRRKTLPNALHNIISKDRLMPVLDSVGISPQARAEDLTIQQFACLTAMLQG